MSRALGVLLTSFLLVPWVLGCREAYRAADTVQPCPTRAQAIGLVTIHAWAACNVTLLVLIVLTLAGILK